MPLLKDVDINEIVKGCIENKSKYQYEFFIRFSESLYATCIRYVGCEDKAKDVLQESFISIFKYIHTFDPNKATLYTWLNKICINQSLKFLKSNYSIVDYYEKDQVEVANSAPTADEIMETKELFDLIVKLPEPYRTVFNLYEIEGYSHLEIAEVLHIKEASSRSILSRSKKLLIGYFQNFQIKGV